MTPNINHWLKLQFAAAPHPSSLASWLKNHHRISNYGRPQHGMPFLYLQRVSFYTGALGSFVNSLVNLPPQRRHLAIFAAFDAKFQIFVFVQAHSRTEALQRVRDKLPTVRFHQAELAPYRVARVGPFI